MSNPQNGMFGRRGIVATPPRGEAIAVFETYEQAQAAVEKLVHADFAVQSVSIVGNDLKSVERVTGRLSYGRAAGAGAVSGLWFGLFIGALYTFFSSGSGAFFFGAILLGAAFGMLFGVASYAVTRRRRDFSSVMQVVASSYALLVDPEQANRARNLVGVDASAPVTIPPAQ